MNRYPRSARFLLRAILFAGLAAVICGAASAAKAQAPGNAAAAPGLNEYLVIAWNDLGMHCMNPFYSHLALLPPWNTAWAQVIRRGSASEMPALVQDGVTIDYSVQRNTYSVGKTDFWTYAEALFGAALPDSIGLTGNGMTGNLAPHEHGWIVEGIPLTPYEDDNWTVMEPYQLGDFVLRDANTGAVLDETTVVLPVSVEMHCGDCHHGNSGTDVAVLQKHDDEEGTNLLGSQPVLCANCHADAALGAPGLPGLPSLSLAIHKKHKGVGGIACYQCHPGPETQCMRGVHAQAGMTCESCHGTLREMSTSLEQGRRPWLDEPSCGTCHGAAYAPEPDKLYRNSRGHGGLYCEACHGSPHAILPSMEPRDNLQNIRLQGYAGKLDDCTVCHGSVPDGPGPHGYRPPATATPAASATPLPATATPTPSPTPAPTGTPEPDYALGDVTRDGLITPGDALLAIEIALEMVQPDPEQFRLADVNLDGMVTPGDALCIFKESLGIPNECFTAATAGSANMPAKLATALDWFAAGKGSA